MSQPLSNRVAAGARVLVLVEQGDRELDDYLAAIGAALSAAGYRLRHDPKDVLGCALVHVYGADECLAAWRRGFLGMTPVLVSLTTVPKVRQYSGLTGQFRRWLTGRALASATFIVVPSEVDRSALLRLFPNLRSQVERIQVIQRGVPIPQVAVAKTARTSAQVTIGMTHEHPVMTEVFGRVQRFGGVPTLKFDTSETCDLFIAPTDKAWAGAMRAMCAGIPVLGCAALRELFVGSPSRVYGPSVAEAEVALRQALCELWTDEALQYQPLARERFDVRHTAARLVALYDDLTSHTKLRAA